MLLLMLHLVYLLFGGNEQAGHECDAYQRYGREQFGSELHKTHTNMLLKKALVIDNPQKQKKLSSHSLHHYPPYSLP
jgi:hypothetical protein